MNFDEFLDALSDNSFRVSGRSFAFGDHNGWLIAFIRIGGKFQTPGNVAFVLCARPLLCLGMEGQHLSDSKEPHEYPFKLTRSKASKRLKYLSQLCNYEHDEMRVGEDWSGVLRILKNTLPQSLDRLGLAGLRKQLDALSDPGYVEKIWLRGLDA